MASFHTVPRSGQGSGEKTFQQNEKQKQKGNGARESSLSHKPTFSHKKKPFCKKWGLTVNMDIGKVLIFKNGAILRIVKNDFAENELTGECCYNYLVFI